MTVRSRGTYGLDGPGMFVIFAFAVPLSVVIAVITNRGWIWALVAYLTASAALSLYSTKRGKFVVWKRALDDLALRGDERVLDIGCGRGAVLNLAAARLPAGRAIGIDLWSSRDQSGNSPEMTLRNAQREGVAGRIEVNTGDFTDLPFPDATFDVIVSSLAIHNELDDSARDKAIDEAVRVLRPGGDLVIVDIFATARYRTRLEVLGMADVRRRNLGPRMWWSGPWVSTSLVAATKPAAT